MSATRQILSTKIKPTLIIGDDLTIFTRNIKSNKKPPKRSEDCDKSFKEFNTYDNSDAVLNEDYTSIICNDLINDELLEEDIENIIDFSFVILKDKHSSINAKRLQIFSTNTKLLKTKKLINKTSTHKATVYIPNSLTICSIYQEENSIFNHKFIDELRKLKVKEDPKDGYFILPTDLTKLEE
jgi:hypothetical protein